MQLCQIHFYQKITRKKVARVNATLGRFSSANQCFCWNHTDSLSDFLLFTTVYTKIAKFLGTGRLTKT